jgi:hypothetical protein
VSERGAESVTGHEGKQFNVGGYVYRATYQQQHVNNNNINKVDSAIARRIYVREKYIDIGHSRKA